MSRRMGNFFRPRPIADHITARPAAAETSASGHPPAQAALGSPVCEAALVLPLRPGDVIGDDGQIAIPFTLKQTLREQRTDLIHQLAMPTQDRKTPRKRRRAIAYRRRQSSEHLPLQPSQVLRTN